MATEFQKTIFRVCREIIEKKCVKQTKTLRYAILESDQSTLTINTSHYAMTVLANLLLRIHNEIALRDEEKKRKPLPFMLVILDKPGGVYHIHGTHGNVLYGADERLRKK